MTGADDGEPPITFYRLHGCPYCERVVRVLREHDLAYRSRFVEPLHSRRDVVKRVAGVRTVPVIVDGNTGVTMAESANIVSYLEATYGEGAAPEDEDPIATDGSRADPPAVAADGDADRDDADGGAR